MWNESVCLYFQVCNAVNSSLSASAGEAYSRLQPLLWEAIDTEICLSECDIYRYGLYFSQMNCYGLAEDQSSLFLWVGQHG